MKGVYSDILITDIHLRERIQEMGEMITKDYKDERPVMIGALKGCFIFMADLVRAINLPVTVDFMEISSYENEKESSGIVKILKDVKYSIQGKHVLLVEDIIDTGLTLNHVIDHLKLQKPASIKIVSLLVKAEKHKMKYPIDYFGFEIEDRFVVGYGLDYQGYYRNLECVAVIEE